jgi:RimJ/RimL family protein N-acetyltransferase
MISAFTVDAERELTYWIDPSRWGLGIASDALRIFLTVEKQRPLYARVAAGNRGSRRVLEKAGFEMLREEVSSYARGLGEETAAFVFRLH